MIDNLPQLLRTECESKDSASASRPLEKYWSSWGGVRILLGRYLYEPSVVYDSVTYGNKSEGIKVSPQGVSDNWCAMKPWSKVKQSGLCSLRRARKGTNGLAWWLTPFSACPLLCLGAKCGKITWFWCAGAVNTTQSHLAQAGDGDLLTEWNTHTQSANNWLGTS